jgi:hypothetical protein
VFAIDDVRAYVADVLKLDLHDRKVDKPLELRKALVAGGMQSKKGKRYQISENCKSFVASNFEIDDAQTWADLKEYYFKPPMIDMKSQSQPKTSATSLINSKVLRGVKKTSDFGNLSVRQSPPFSQKTVYFLRRRQ